MKTTSTTKISPKIKINDIVINATYYCDDLDRLFYDDNDLVSDLLENSEKIINTKGYDESWHINSIINAWILQKRILEKNIKKYIDLFNTFPPVNTIFAHPEFGEMKIINIVYELIDDKQISIEFGILR